MMKNIVQYLASIVITVLITACLAIPMTTTLGVLVTLILVQLLINAAADHLKNKQMPSIVEWVQYAFEVVALILFACGFAYTSTYCLIFAIIAAIIALICAIVSNKKTPMVMDPETPIEEEKVEEEPVVEETPVEETTETTEEPKTEK